MHKQINQNRGFTLIEILLVIAILSVITVMSLSIYQKHATTNKIEKMALQIQTIQQAAAAYYVNNQKWPQDIDDTDFLNYIPFGAGGIGVLNPWGYKYSVSPVPSSKGLLFQVSAQTPSSEISRRVAGLLPFAQADDDSNVIAQMNIPGQATSNMYQINIKAMGYVAFKSSSDNFPTVAVPQDCPMGTTPKLYLTLSYFRTDDSSWRLAIAEPISKLKLSYSPTNIDPKNLPSYWTLNAEMNKLTGCLLSRSSCKEESQSFGHDYLGAPVMVKAFYMVLCCPSSGVCGPDVPDS